MKIREQGIRVIGLRTEDGHGKDLAVMYFFLFYSVLVQSNFGMS